MSGIECSHLSPPTRKGRAQTPPPPPPPVSAHLMRACRHTCRLANKSLTSITGHARTQTRKIRTAPKGDSGAKAPKPEALVKNEGKGHLKSFDKAPAEPLGVPWSGTGSKGLEQEGCGVSLAVDGAKAPTAGDAASECAGETERGREGERERSRASERELQR